MKNLFLIKTDKPSRLLWCFEDKRHYTSIDEIYFKNQKELENQHIYITNDEEIKTGDWYKSGKFIWQMKYSQWGKEGQGDAKKIILTTDPELIADGVQAIPDEFLEWFVKNPSCESVQVENTCLEERQCMCESNENCLKDGYKIIIPQEEPKTGSLLESIQEVNKDLLREINELKQETLEEFAERMSTVVDGIDSYSRNGCKKAIIIGAKYQAEKSYSEEEAGELVYNIMGEYGKLCGIILNGEKINELFEQFKKKA